VKLAGEQARDDALRHDAIAAVINHRTGYGIQALDIGSVYHLDAQQIVVNVLVGSDITTDLFKSLATVKGVAEEYVVVDVQVRLFRVHGINWRNATVDNRPNIIRLASSNCNAILR